MKNLSGKHWVRRRVKKGKWNAWTEDVSPNNPKDINKELADNGCKLAIPVRVRGGCIAWEYEGYKRPDIKFQRIFPSDFLYQEMALAQYNERKKKK